MGSSKLGGIFGYKKPSETAALDQGPQYIKLNDGTMTEYDASKAQLNYAQQTRSGKDGSLRVMDGTDFKRGTSALESATYDGKGIELENGAIKFYNQNDFSSWQTAQQNAELQAQKDLETKRKANTQNLANTRTNANSRSQSILNQGGAPRTAAGSGVFSGITE